MTALWYWALVALLALATIAAFWFFRWSLATEATRLTRRIDVLNADGIEDRIARMYWTHMREVESLLACMIAMKRAIHEHPDRVAALMSEGVPLHDAVAAVAS